MTTTPTDISLQALQQEADWVAEDLTRNEKQILCLQRNRLRLEQRHGELMAVIHNLREGSINV